MSCKNFLLWGMVVIFGGIILSGSLSCAKRTNVPTNSMEIESVSSEQARSDLLPESDGLEVETIEVEQVANRTSKPMITLEDIYFDFDKSSLTPEARSTLKKNYETLISIPDVTAIIEGHCDERGTIEYNLALGQRRAETVRNYLVSLGISDTQLNTISYGKERPVDPRSDEKAWSKNRRAHTLIDSQ